MTDEVGILPQPLSFHFSYLITCSWASDITLLSLEFILKAIYLIYVKFLAQTQTHSKAYSNSKYFFIQQLFIVYQTLSQSLGVEKCTEEAQSFLPWLTFLNSSIENLHYLRTASMVKGILLSDLLRCHERTVHFKMEQFMTFCHCIGNVYLILLGKQNCFQIQIVGVLVFSCLDSVHQALTKHLLCSCTMLRTGDAKMCKTWYPPQRSSQSVYGQALGG